MIKDVAWMCFGFSALVGLLMRNRDMQAPDPEDLACQAGRYADAMLDQWRNRVCGDWKDNR